MIMSQRNSNIELLRLVSMVFVMVVHASFLSLDPPSKEYILSSPNSAFLRCLCESLSIVCVNSFILISGWFGIHLKTLRLLELFFQVVFFALLVPIILYAFGQPVSESIDTYLRYFFFCDELWFVRAYFILLLFSPLLNVFVDHSDKHQLQYFLIAFFVVQTLLGHKLEWFSRGYSPMSFMGIYLLARYMRLYPSRITVLRKSTDLLLYLGLVILLTLSAMFVIYTRIIDIGTLYAYSSPLVISCSVFFFLFFSKLSFSSRVVNWIAISAFSIYLMHCNPLFLSPIYLTYIREWYSLEICSFLYHTIFFMSLIAVVSILVDKLRLLVWNWFFSKKKMALWYDIYITLFGIFSSSFLVCY